MTSDVDPVPRGPQRSDPTNPLPGVSGWCDPTVHVSNTLLQGRNILNRGMVIMGDYPDAISVGYATTFGFDGIVMGRGTIGRYCQFGCRLSLRSNDHPLKQAGMYVNRQLLDGLIGRYREYHPFSIGHDVWSGDNVTITAGVTVSTGAVLGANSVVTRDVPPYGIVAGAPARLIRRRFADAVCDALLDLAWWELDVEQMEAIAPVFTVDLTQDEATALTVLEEGRQAKNALLRGRTGTDPQG